MSNREINETAKVLIEAKGLIADPEKWVADAAIDVEKHGGLCALGAVASVIGLTLFSSTWDSPAGEALDKAAEDLFGDAANIAYVNDHLGHEAVMRCFDLAISRALQGVES